MHELILGGQKCGKSRRAEQLARQWLDASSEHRVVFVVTAQAGDEEMAQCIARHQADRALRLPTALTVEEPLQVAQAIAVHSDVNTLVVVDCLTLWLTNWMFPRHSSESVNAQAVPTQALLDAVQTAPGAVVVVSNEIGWGVIPMGSQVREFVYVLGCLNQSMAEVCDRVTLMAAGLPLTLKAGA